MTWLLKNTLIQLYHSSHSIKNISPKIHTALTHPQTFMIYRNPPFVSGGCAFSLFFGLQFLPVTTPPIVHHIKNHCTPRRLCYITPDRNHPPQPTNSAKTTLSRYSTRNETAATSPLRRQTGFAHFTIKI